MIDRKKATLDELPVADQHVIQKGKVSNRSSKHAHTKVFVFFGTVSKCN
jgi:hypothetical protein